MGVVHLWAPGGHHSGCRPLVAWALQWVSSTCGLLVGVMVGIVHLLLLVDVTVGVVYLWAPGERHSGRRPPVGSRWASQWAWSTCGLGITVGVVHLQAPGGRHNGRCPPVASWWLLSTCALLVGTVC